MGNIARMDPKPPAKCWVMYWPSPLTPSAKSCFSKYQAWTPTPPLRIFLVCLGKLIDTELSFLQYITDARNYSIIWYDLIYNDSLKMHIFENKIKLEKGEILGGGNYI